MSRLLSRAEVDELANLARLALDDATRERLRGELGAILGALEGTISDRAPQCFLIVAPPDMGKSHLVRELVGRVEALPEPVSVVRARAEDVRRETPYATLSELLRRARHRR